MESCHLVRSGFEGSDRGIGDFAGDLVAGAM